MTNGLHQLLYVSVCVDTLEERAVHEILEQARARNAARSITGALIYSGGHFAQALEGPESQLVALLGSIRRDVRHRSVQILLFAPLSQRRFEGWSMGFVYDLSAADLLAELSLAVVDEPRALRLVDLLFLRAEPDVVMPSFAGALRPSSPPSPGRRLLKRAAAVSMAPLNPTDLDLLKTLSLEVRHFDSTETFLVSPDAYEYDLFVVGGHAPMSESLGLVRLLFRRSTAPVVAWNARAPCAAWLDAGADMWLPRSASTEDLLAAIRALDRRMPVRRHSPSGLSRTWRLDFSARLLHTPGGQQIPLSETDSLVLECFAKTEGAVVSYSDLGACLGHQRPEADNWLRATLYRLRRRIEQATGEAAPIDAKARRGYLFRERLQKDA